jgi:protoporphyrinogen oxidase
MAVDFEALDLVRSQNKSRSYNKRLDDLQRKNQGLQKLVQEMVQEVPVHRKIHFEEKLKKIKKSY